MSQSQKIQAVVTSVDIGTPIALAATPLLGGAGRNGILRCPVLPLTSTVKIQGAPLIDVDTGVAPAEDSDKWADLATVTSTSEHQSEIVLPDFIRWNTTVLDADGPDVFFYVEASP